MKLCINACATIAFNSIEWVKRTTTNRWFLFSAIQTNTFPGIVCSCSGDQLNDQHDINNTHFEAFQTIEVRTEKNTKTNWNSKECWAPRNPMLGHNLDKKKHFRSFRNEVNSWTFHSFRHLIEMVIFSLNSISTFPFWNDITPTVIKCYPLSSRWIFYAWPVFKFRRNLHII